MSIDAEYQQEVGEFVHSHVQSNVGSLFWEMRERMDYGYHEILRERFENFETYDEEEDRHHFAEVYEWWTVSDYLFRKLKQHGEVVADLGSCYVWGRQTTGQAIKLDYIIQDIYDELQRH